MTDPPVWTREELGAARQLAENHFRTSRHTEPPELYGDLFDDYQGVVEDFFELTVDLTQLEENASAILNDSRAREVLRYITGPPVSEDDLMMLVETTSLSPARLSQDPALVSAIIAFVHDWLDRRRFPWFRENREPPEYERNAAILATTALMAMRRLETMRRNDGKAQQEQHVEETLLGINLEKVATRKIETLPDGPGRGQFCRESMFGPRKADFVIGLWDGRTMPVECKVSNSQTNSIKRLNNDAVVKAVGWKRHFGEGQVVPAAVLGGCYKLLNLEQAQKSGLTLFWAHDLQPMTDFILSTDSSRPGLSTG